MGGKTTNTVAAPSPEEKAYLSSQQALASKQLEMLNTQADFNKSYMDSIKPLLDQQTAQSNDPVAREIASRTNDLQLQQLKDQADLAPLQRQLLQKQLDDAQRGYGATPEQTAQIDAATNAALKSGQSDLTAFSGDALRQLRENLAPSLGLRPTDTPILDRGALVAQEATRQYGKLVSDLSGANAQAKLNYPLAAAGIQTSAAQFQQGLDQSKSTFQAQLADAAAQNRMRMIGQGVDTGINLVGASKANPLSFQRSSSSTTSNPIGSIATIAGGLGALGLGLGSAGLGFFGTAPVAAAASDARVKRDVKTIAHDRRGRRWVSYDYKEGLGLAKGRQVGVIAQEVERTDPEAVLTNGLGLKFVDYSKLRAA